MKAFVFAAVLMVTASAHGQCVLDINGDQQTSIDELIRAVNHALGGCGAVGRTPPTARSTATRTPTRTVTRTSTPVSTNTRTVTPTRTVTLTPVTECPFRFNDTVTDRFCLYTGPAETSCNGSIGTIGAGWTTLGTQVLAVIVDRAGNAIAIAATRTSATGARVTEVASGPDFDPFIDATGSMALPSRSRFDFDFDTSVTCVNVAFMGQFAAISEPDNLAAIGDVAQAIRAATGDGDGQPAAASPDDASDVARRLYQQIAPF